MLFAGFFVNQNNIPWFLKEFQYMSIFKYGYQALFLNEFEGLTLPCYPKDCDPIGEFDSPESLQGSVIALAGMYVGCHLIALINMISLSRKYEWLIINIYI